MQSRHRQHGQRLCRADGARRAEVGEVDAALARDRRPTLLQEVRQDVGALDLEEEIDDGVALLEIVNGALVAWVGLPPFVVTLGSLSIGRSLAVVLSQNKMI